MHLDEIMAVTANGFVRQYLGNDLGGLISILCRLCIMNGGAGRLEDR